ncbi:hypothetical protein ACWDE9_01965, partial [Streptomyces olivaceoviridis]
MSVSATSPSTPEGPSFPSAPEHSSPSVPEGWREDNKAMWDERVPLHVAGPFYDLEGFRTRRDDLRDFERAEVGDVGGKSLLHLQCHIGTDTLSWL